MELLSKILILAASFFGFYVAWYIRRHKKSGEKMVCPLDSDCENVVHSDYSKFLGIPLEFMGMAYYTIIFMTYVVETWKPGSLPLIATQMVLGTTAAAFVFSIYLIGIQLFKLKEWCTWCLISASMCLIIFITAITR